MMVIDAGDRCWKLNSRWVWMRFRAYRAPHRGMFAFRWV